jgi:hypothetical protein
LQQVQGLALFLSIALFVPVIIALVVSRKDWRAVRNACIVWYSILVLAFNGIFNPDGLGWAMIFAMYFSFVAVPLLSLAFQFGSFVWARFGRSFNDTRAPKL